MFHSQKEEDEDDNCQELFLWRANLSAHSYVKQALRCS